MWGTTVLALYGAGMTHDNGGLPGLPLTLAIMLALVALVAVPVAILCYVVSQHLPALNHVLLGLRG